MQTPSTIHPKPFGRLAFDPAKAGRRLREAVDRLDAARGADSIFDDDAGLTGAAAERAARYNRHAAFVEAVLIASIAIIGIAACAATLPA
ncbi:hypothetical protein [Oricola thermophila]|uniref:Uncharacterized protein n=1 Tax=Oricola thermophila TaxID=2742145 RepID=A0A6N1VH54_9HYPH|nr:hypothetical protein [Oricola thermophila]QKV20266.1 hypothetical protein HTY61_18305 [Oricola thermophila]